MPDQKTTKAHTSTYTVKGNILSIPYVSKNNNGESTPYLTFTENSRSRKLECTPEVYKKINDNNLTHELRKIFVLTVNSDTNTIIDVRTESKDLDRDTTNVSVYTEDEQNTNVVENKIIVQILKSGEVVLKAAPLHMKQTELDAVLSDINKKESVQKDDFLLDSYRVMELRPTETSTFVHIDAQKS